MLLKSQKHRHSPTSSNSRHPHTRIRRPQIPAKRSQTKRQLPRHRRHVINETHHRPTRNNLHDFRINDHKLIKFNTPKVKTNQTRARRSRRHLPRMRRRQSIQQHRERLPSTRTKTKKNHQQRLRKSTRKQTIPSRPISLAPRRSPRQGPTNRHTQLLPQPHQNMSLSKEVLQPQQAYRMITKSPLIEEYTTPTAPRHQQEPQPTQIHYTTHNACLHAQ